MKVSLSFDDGRSDAYDAYLILKKYGMTASFHITTGFVDGTFKTDAFGSGRNPVSKDQIIEMHVNKMDVSSHGDKHVINSDDYLTSVQKFQSWGVLGNIDKIGFSVPNSLYSDNELRCFINDNSNNLAYVRVGRSPKCYSFFSKICYFLYHFTHFFVFFDFFNKHNLLFEPDKYALYSLVVKKDTKSKDLIKFIDKHKSQKGYLILMFHSIVDEPFDGWDYSKSEFEKIVKYLSNNVETLTIKEIVNDVQ